MNDFPTRQLQEIAGINPKADRLPADELVSFVGMADLSETDARTIAETPRPHAEVSKGYTAFRNGDILAAKITPCWQNGKIGQAVLNFEHGRGSTEFHVVRPSSEVDSRYLMHFLRTPAVRENGTLRMTGSGGQRRVPTKYLYDLLVPMRPLADQRRIAAILDESDAIRAKRRSQLTNFAHLAEALFHSSFDTTSATHQLGEVAAVQGGLQVSSKRSFLPITSKYLRVANVHRGRLDLSEIKEIGVISSELDRTRLEPGDLLFVEGHANPQEVGRVALWEGELPECVHQNHLIRARLDTTQAIPVFVEHWMNSSRGRLHFERASRTTSGLNTISASKVRSAPLPLPSIQDQHAFAHKVTAINTERDRVARALEADDELFAALQHRAFRGEL